MYFSAIIKTKAFLRADQNEFTQAQLSNFKEIKLSQDGETLEEALKKSIEQPKWEWFCEVRSLQFLCLHHCPAWCCVLLYICVLLCCLPLPLMICNQLKAEDVIVPELHPYQSAEIRNGFTLALQCLCRCTTWEQDEILFYTKVYLAFVHYIQEILQILLDSPKSLYTSPWSLYRNSWISFFCVPRVSFNCVESIFLYRS